MLTLKPHGAKMNNIIYLFYADFQDLEKGITMDFNGKKKLVNVFLMAITGNIPQQAANSGLFSHKAVIRCQSCYYPKTHQADLSYNVIYHGKYHFETKEKHIARRQIQGQSRK